MDDRWIRRGSWVYPIQEDPDHQGAGCSGPAVQAGSGLTAPGLAEVASWRSATRPASHHPHPTLHVIIDAARIRTLLIKPSYVRGQVPNAPGRKVPRWRVDSFSARLRFARLGCLAAQIALLKPGFVTSSVRRWRDANGRFEFYKRRQLFICPHDETLSVAMGVNNPDCSSFGING